LLTPVSEPTVSIVGPAADTRSWVNEPQGVAVEDLRTEPHLPGVGVSRRGGDKRSLWTRRTAIAGVGGVMLVALAVMAPILLRVETDVGTILLEVEQPEITGAVVIVDGQKKITIKPGREQEPIEVVADKREHTLRVTKGGFETFTDRFTVREGEAVRIRVRLERNDIATAAPELPPAPEQPIETEPNRSAAQWVLGQGGLVTVRHALGGKNLKAGDKLPDGPLEVSHIDLTGLSTISDGDLSRFHGLAKLASFVVHSTPITAASLIDLVEKCPSIIELGMNDIAMTAGDARRLGRQTRLRRINCYGCGLDDKSIEPIVQLPQINQLNLGRTTIGDATMEKLSGRVHLEALFLTRAHVTDLGLKSLANCKNLHQLDIQQTKVSEEGVRELSAALPRCTINWQGGQIGPSPAPELAPIPLRRAAEQSIPLVDFRRWPRNPDYQQYEQRGLVFDAMTAPGNLATTVADVWAKDVTLRAKLRLRDVKEGGAALFAARNDYPYPRDALPYVLFYIGKWDGVIMVSLHNGKGGKFQKLASAPMPPPDADGFWDVEFSVRGTHMTAQINGQLLAEAEDDLATEAARISLGAGNAHAEWVDPVILLHDPPEQIREGIWLPDAELLFNGANNVVLIPTLTRTQQKSFTIEAWVTPGAAGRTGAQLVSVAGPGMVSLLIDRDGKLGATVHYATPEQPQNTAAAAGGSLPVGKRSHVAARGRRRPACRLRRGS
jgi:hypothetical protein